jgi:hypothetical protein
MNPELITSMATFSYNPSIAPIYLGANNVLIPIVNLSNKGLVYCYLCLKQSFLLFEEKYLQFNNFYNIFTDYTSYSLNILSITLSTGYFMLKQLITELLQIMTKADKILFCLLIYIFISFLFENYKLNIQINKLIEVNKVYKFELEKFEEKIKYLKKSQELSLETKVSFLEKQIKKMNKEIYKYT